jgi:hypothetical protein
MYGFGTTKSLRLATIGFLVEVAFAEWGHCTPNSGVKLR